MSSLLDKYYECHEKYWKHFINEYGIQINLGPESLYQAMDKHTNRDKVKKMLNNGIPIVANKHMNMFTNFFTFYDPAHGIVCDKCLSLGGIVLLMDDNFTENMDIKIPIPSIELYYSIGIKPYTKEFMGILPVPGNPFTDFWYCPFCHELREFGYSREIGMYF